MHLFIFYYFTSELSDRWASHWIFSCFDCILFNHLIPASFYCSLLYWFIAWQNLSLSALFFFLSSRFHVLSLSYLFNSCLVFTKSDFNSLSFFNYFYSWFPTFISILLAHFHCGFTSLFSLNCFCACIIFFFFSLFSLYLCSFFYRFLLNLKPIFSSHAVFSSLPHPVKLGCFIVAICFYSWRILLARLPTAFLLPYCIS